MNIFMSNRTANKNNIRFCYYANLSNHDAQKQVCDPQPRPIGSHMVCVSVYVCLAFSWGILFEVFFPVKIFMS